MPGRPVPTAHRITVTADTLLNIANAAVGVLGYFECRPERVDITPDGFVIHWDHYGKPSQLKLDHNGRTIREEQ